MRRKWGLESTNRKVYLNTYESAFEIKESLKNTFYFALIIKIANIKP